MSESERGIVKKPSLEELYGTDPEVEDAGILMQTGGFTPDGRPTGIWFGYVHRYSTAWLDAQQRHAAPFRHRGRPLTAQELMLIDQNAMFDVGLPKPWENMVINWQMALDRSLIEDPVLRAMVADPESIPRDADAPFTRKNWLAFANDRKVGRKLYARVMMMAQDHTLFAGARWEGAHQADVGNS